MPVKVRIYNSRDNQHVADAEYDAVPAIGSQIMILSREWEVWGVDGVRMFPSEPGAPGVFVYASYGGELP